MAAGIRKALQVSTLQGFLLFKRFGQKH